MNTKYGWKKLSNVVRRFDHTCMSLIARRLMEKILRFLNLLIKYALMFDTKFISHRVADAELVSKPAHAVSRGDRLTERGGGVYASNEAPTFERLDFNANIVST